MNRPHPSLPRNRKTQEWGLSYRFRKYKNDTVSISTKPITNGAKNLDINFIQSANRSNGYTLLELIAVIAVLGILSSLAIPPFANWIKQSKIDGVQTQVNSAAADCLQRLRTSDDANLTVDPNIISDENLEQYGYKLSEGGNKCSYFSIEPIDSNETHRYPLGFAIGMGKLTKLATPTGSDSLPSCKAWAGENCKVSEELKAHVKYLEQITAAKNACESAYNQWINAKSSGSSVRWNPAGDSKCPPRPPITEAQYCTTNACNRTVYALDGIIVGYTQDDYDKALEEKYGRICTENVEKLRKQQPPYTNPQESPVTFTECGPQEFWFHKGTQVPTQEQWRGLMCDDEVAKNINTVNKTTLPYCGNKMYYFCDGKDQLNEEKYNQCIASNAEAKCISDRESARQSGYKGKYGPFEGPGACGEVRWMCNQVELENEEEYNKTTCGAKPIVCELPNPACEQQRYYYHPICEQYSKCKGRI